MKNYWWLCADPDEWKFSSIREGETQGFYNKTKPEPEAGKRRANFGAAQVGDCVIGYQAGEKKVCALLQVSGKDANYLYFRKLEDVSNPLDYDFLKSCQELKGMSYLSWHSGTLFPLEKREYDFIVAEIRKRNTPPVPYGREEFLEEVFMDAATFDSLAGVLRYRKNLILQGAPGVGKTHAAKRLACAMAGKKDDSRIAFVQFHQNYSYEDFVEGYRPSQEGDREFELKPGIFLSFCQEARMHPEEDFFFIIDEINRGNVSKIFGELLMLIEKDYRAPKGRATLAYSGQEFSVPENLYVIGMMNTADRSLTMVDYALRRRFSFMDMSPAFGTASFERYQKTLGSEAFDKLVEEVKKLNKTITDDDSLGAGFCIGHSYFCGLEAGPLLPERLKTIVEYDILPLLREYWQDDKKKVQPWEKALREALL